MPETPPSWRDRLASLPVEPARLLGAGVAALAVVVAGVVAAVVLRPPPPSPGLTLPPAVGGPAAEGPTEPVGDVFVHAAGAVVRPGVYRVRPGGRVADVLDAAGGPHPEADLDQLNLAAKVADGDRVLVPRRGEQLAEAAPDGSVGQSGATGSQTGPVNLNTATAQQLEELPGVGPATAEAILDYRRQHGRFRSVDELIEVRGIGEAKLAALRSKVRV